MPLFSSSWQITNITKLKDFLLQHRKDYINAGRYASPSLRPQTESTAWHCTHHCTE